MSLLISKTRSVVIALSCASSPFYSGVARYAKLRSWRLALECAHTRDVPRTWSGDGMIVEGSYDCFYADQPRFASMPCVVIDCGPFRHGRVRVQCDDQLIGRVAAEHLVSRGCRNFVWAPFSNDAHNVERGIGFKEALREYGYEGEDLDPVFDCRSGTWAEYSASRAEVVGRRLLQMPRGTGVFAFNDGVASELLQLCHDLQVNVPGDVSILGVGNDPVLSSLSPVSLSSIDPHFEEMGFEAARLLDLLLEGAVGTDHVVRVPPKGVVTRLSTGIPAVEDARVREALVFISEAYINPGLSVTDVAAAVRVSRRSIERAFRQEVGVPIAEYIASIRMQEAARLLRTHDRAKVADVAGLVGLSAQTNFFRRFRRHFGVTPKNYIKQIEREPAIRKAC